MPTSRTNGPSTTRRDLPIVRDDAALVCSGRGCAPLPRRNLSSAVPEPSPVRPVRRLVSARVPVVGGSLGIFPRWPVRDWPGHRDHGGECESFDRVRVRMSLLPPLDQRTTRLLFLRRPRPPAPRFQVWIWSSWLNARHMTFAGCSLVWVALTDLYIYLISSGSIRDVNTG